MRYARNDCQGDRVVRLKKEIDNLRVSRRILMYLVERLEKERQQLEYEKQKLKKSNSRYAQEIVRKNIEIVELRSILHEKGSTY